MNATTRPGRRTDVHAPSSPDFDPQAYTCYGVFDFTPEFDGSEIQRRIELVNAMLAKGYRFGGSTTGGCGHCGTNIRYGALMARDDVMQMIWVGETCLDGRFELEKGEFQKLRKTASLNRERMARDARFEVLCDENPDLAYATYAENIYNVVVDEKTGARFGNVSGCFWALSTLIDIARKARQYGDPSPRQLALVSKLMGEISVKADAYAAKVAEQANKPAAKDVPTGRVEITGTIIKVDTRRNDYTGALRVVMTVEHADGWRVWGTMPASLDNAKADKGDVVTFTATVKASDDDITFGYFTRPVKASIVK